MHASQTSKQNTLRRKLQKIIVAGLLAVAVSATPMFMDTLLETDMTTLAQAGRPQSGGGEY